MLADFQIKFRSLKETKKNPPNKRLYDVQRSVRNSQNNFHADFCSALKQNQKGETKEKKSNANDLSYLKLE